MIGIKGDLGISERCWLDHFELDAVVLSILKDRRAIKEIIVENFTFSAYDDKILMFSWQDALKLRLLVARIASSTRNKLALFIYLLQTKSFQFDFLTFYYNSSILSIFQQMSTCQWNG